MRERKRQRKSAATNMRVDWPLQDSKASSASFKDPFAARIADTAFQVIVFLATEGLNLKPYTVNVT